MGVKSLILCWAFIAGAAGYDTAFAWEYRTWFASWEMNPIARWLAHDFGLWPLFAFKALGLLLAGGLAVYCHFRRHCLERPLTYSICAVYAFLSLHYLLGR